MEFKRKVYIDKSDTPEELKLTIIQRISRISTEMVNAVMSSFIERVRLCLTIYDNNSNDILMSHT